MPRGQYNRKKKKKEDPIVVLPPPTPPEQGMTITRGSVPKVIDVRPLEIGRPQRKPTDKQLVDYVKFALGQLRVHLRGDAMKDVSKLQICLKITKRF